MAGPTLEDVATPACVVDVRRMLRNIHKMAEKAHAYGAVLRPHLKTHKCRQIAALQLAAGAIGTFTWSPSLNRHPEGRSWPFVPFQDLPVPSPSKLSKCVGGSQKRVGASLAH